MNLYNTEISEAVQDACKDPHALPSSFLCVYRICGCLYPGGLLPHQGSETMDPERISSTWTGVVRKPHTHFFSLPLSLSFHFFLLHLFISQSIIYCRIVLYHSSLTSRIVLPLAKVSTVHYSLNVFHHSTHSILYLCKTDEV